MLPLATVAVVVGAVLVAVTLGSGLALRATEGIAREPPQSMAMGDLLRANSEALASALQAATQRADAAVAERERTAARLEQCEADLAQRDEYLKAAAPEVRKLREELREAQDALLRTEAYFGAAAMVEAQKHRGWLRRALAMGADLPATSWLRQRDELPEPRSAR